MIIKQGNQFFLLVDEREHSPAAAQAWEAFKSYSDQLYEQLAQAKAELAEEEAAATRARLRRKRLAL